MEYPENVVNRMGLGDVNNIKSQRALVLFEWDAAYFHDSCNLYARIPKFERFFRIKITAAFVAARKRILATLQKSVRERYIEFCQSHPNIEKRLPNYHLANYLGIQPESLAR